MKKVKKYFAVVSLLVAFAIGVMFVRTLPLVEARTDKVSKQDEVV